MKKIRLKNSRVVYALVDDADYQKLSSLKWYLVKTKTQRIGYAQNKQWKKGIYMHRLLMGNPTGKQVDHIDGNSLNNQRANLRVCSRSENYCNSPMQKNNKAGFKGVSFVGGRWIARISKNKKTYNLGSYKSAVEAARAYDLAATSLHGAFARKNFL